MSGLNVLVVDDNRSAADTLALFFKLEGHEVRTAYDGEEAVATARSGGFDLILMDIGMPQLDGCEAARRIGNMKLEKSPAMVALTGWSGEEDIQRTRDAGFVRHLVKPVEPNDLRALLRDIGLAQDEAG